MRYFNFHEWIALWKVKGQILPKDFDLVRDNVCYIFLQMSKWQTTIQFSFKYTFLMFSLIWIKLLINPKNLFKDENFQNDEDLSPG